MAERYAWCGLDCTADCGHCKGQGPPWTPETLELVAGFNKHHNEATRDRCPTCRLWARRLLTVLADAGLLVGPRERAVIDAARDFYAVSGHNAKAAALFSAVEELHALDAPATSDAPEAP